MLIWSVAIYLAVSLAIGVYVAFRVRNTTDFVVAGRSLPLPVVMATIFATWFGSETVFGVSATFVKDGMRGVVADPFGASLCLILAGIFYGSKLYKLNVLTLGDFFRMRYNRTVEVLTTLCIVASYLGWVSAQIKALGLVFNVVSVGAITQTTGMVMGAAIVLAYTTFGGMLSVAILDFVQMIMIMGGMFFIASIFSEQTGGAAVVISHASAAGKLDFFPEADVAQWLAFLGAWITMALGSIPQQDVFQRVTSAKSVKVAIIGSMLGGTLYFCFAMLPMFIAYSATLIDPDTFNELAQTDAQMVLPTLILQHTPVFAQAIFYGAVLSAIMSTASATLLAPSVAFSENILRNYFPGITDHSFLRMLRITIVCFACVVLGFALGTDDSIFKMVENAYKVTLSGAFSPLIFGAYWKRSTTQGALFSIVGGVSSWIVLEILAGDTSMVPPQLIGLGVGILGMIAGSLLPQWIGLPHLAGDERAEQLRARQE
ncbi:sodium:solute symporter family protein [Propionivibrio sp.]|uniref:sodium:solute symporter family protein n=1 Tax=Propionivibrio sp. TaxID=2212460 RepID=UPI0025CF831B|nr:sodium:solute symporter family protein [Propionivibrio sp.]MBK8399820.1 sodium:solute symporter family protein [Propionivibrio sp.]MBK8894694.1 sodium:solute symporter family protein [Propionivibrio sp.]MBL0207175.1 sodium:solute symporter family protein [Propionivibrio sp.]